MRSNRGMSLFRRHVVAHTCWIALGLAPAIASAQDSSNAAPPPGGAPAPAATEKADEKKGDEAPKADEKKGDIGGYAYSDKPAPVRARRAVRRTGPFATLPGFEQLPDGGSRLQVHLSQALPVEERRAEGSITYVLKGANLRVHNDSLALVTVHFNTPVLRAHLTPSGHDVLFVVELRSAVTPTFQVTTNADKTSTLKIDFAKGDFLKSGDPEALLRKADKRAKPVAKRPR